ncbi:dsDNA nuclease domain-containing protein [Amycolatopsis sp. NPDC004378]
MTNPPTSANELLDAVSKLESDPTGVDTFRRYVWQAKQVVRIWCTSLGTDSTLKYVICEHVEDVTLIYDGSIKFVQLKTRTRGSWSVPKMCTSGLDALARSYNESLKHNCNIVSTFELWLEGPISEAPDTVKFVQDPRTANSATRTKLIKLGVPKAQLDDFLSRLAIRPNQSPRADIDAKAVYELNTLWPSMSQPEAHALYERLLQFVTAAQQADVIPSLFAKYLGRTEDSKFATVDSTDGTPANLNILQVLSSEDIRRITPPTPAERADKLLGRVSEGSTLSMLELKLDAAGADEDTKEDAKRLRADMEIQRQLLIASRDNAEDQLESLASRVLIVAKATARKVDQEGAMNPAISSRPARAISAHFLSNPNILGGLDTSSLFAKDGLQVYGFLAHLSDGCRFSWKDAR